MHAQERIHRDEWRHWFELGGKRHVYQCGQSGPPRSERDLPFSLEPSAGVMAVATLWINQAPFTATKEDIAAHFSTALGLSAAAVAPSVRLVYKNGSFGGVAFVDVRDWSKIKPALALHQSSLRCADGAARRINVREAVSKEDLAKLAERSTSKRGVVLAKAFGSKGQKTGSRVPPAAQASASDGGKEVKARAEEGDDDGEGEGGGGGGGGGEAEDEDATVAACIRWAEREAEREAAMAKTGEGGGGTREDMRVRCKDCTHDFIFSVVEQAYGHPLERIPPHPNEYRLTLTP